MCTSCVLGFILVSGECVCDESQGLFFNKVSATCVQCGDVLSHTLNCKECTSNALTFSSVGFECLICDPGYYLEDYDLATFGKCNLCSPGCLKCSSFTKCCKCAEPTHILVAGKC